MFSKSRCLREINNLIKTTPHISFLMHTSTVDRGLGTPYKLFINVWINARTPDLPRNKIKGKGDKIINFVINEHIVYQTVYRSGRWRGASPQVGRTEDTAVTKQTGGAQKALPCTGRSLAVVSPPPHPAILTSLYETLRKFIVLNSHGDMEGVGGVSALVRTTCQPLDPPQEQLRHFKHNLFQLET